MNSLCFIDNRYGRFLSTFGWSWNTDGDAMERSGLARFAYRDTSSPAMFVAQFDTYLQLLAQDTDTDYYSTFLKIVDVLGLNGSLLDKRMEAIFLGNPYYSHA